MLDKSLFPRWVFKPGGQTLLTKSPQDHDQALQDGWFGTVGETDAPVSSEVPLTSPEAHEPDADAPPTREELEAKATELGIEFSPRIGDKKLAERIESALSGGEA